MSSSTDTFDIFTIPSFTVLYEGKFSPLGLFDIDTFVWNIYIREYLNCKGQRVGVDACICVILLLKYFKRIFSQFLIGFDHFSE